MKKTGSTKKEIPQKKRSDKPVVTGTHPPAGDSEKDYDDLAHEKAGIPATNSAVGDPDDLVHPPANEEEDDSDELMREKNNRGRK